MRAVVFDFNEKQFVLRKDVKKPHPMPGEACIQVMAASVNPIEAKHEIWSSLVDENKRNEFVMGVDMAGIIESINTEEDDCEFKVGDRVVCHPWLPNGQGSFADFCICRNKFLVKIPDNVPFEHAAVTPVAGWTAYKSLVIKMRVEENRSVVITGGNGGLGGFGIQFAKLCGCNPIISTCSPSSNSRVLQLGATHCIDYRSSDVVGEIMAIVGPGGVDYIMDGIGGDSAKVLYQTLAFDGQIACVAGVMPRESSEPYFKGITVHDIALAPCAYLGSERGVALWREMGNAVMALLSEKKIDPMIGRTLTLEELPEVMNTGHSAIGKTVIKVHMPKEK